VCPGHVHTEFSERALEADGRAHAEVDAASKNGLTASECAARVLAAYDHGRDGSRWRAGSSWPWRSSACRPPCFAPRWHGPRHAEEALGTRRRRYAKATDQGMGPSTGVSRSWPPPAVRRLRAWCTVRATVRRS